METQNLWPDFPVEAAKSPKAILREQAGYLMAKTNNILSAEIETLQSLKQLITHNFYVVAPAINNYRYQLLSVAHSVFFYPLTIAANGYVYEIENQEDFINKLSEVFNQPDTVQVISSLLAQSLAE